MKTNLLSTGPILTVLTVIATMSPATTEAETTYVALTAGAPTMGAGTSDYFTFGLPGAQFSITIPENSPLDGAIIIPTLNGVPLAGNTDLAPTVLYDDAAFTEVSDVFGVLADPTTGAAVFGFVSDPDGLLAMPAFVNPNRATIPLLETGATLSVGQYLLPGTTGITAGFFSDVERSVPDTGTSSVLLGVGVVALGWARRKLA